MRNSFMLLLVLFSYLVQCGYAVESEAGFVLFVKKSGQTAGHFCFFGITTEANLTTESYTLRNSLVESSTAPSVGNARIAVLAKSSDILGPNFEFAVGTLVLAPAGGPIKDRLSELSREHPQTVFAQLTASDFRRLSAMAESTRDGNLTVAVAPDQPSEFAGSSVPVFIFVYCCAFVSILLGSIMICLTREEILLRIQDLIEQSKRSKWACFLAMIGLLILLVSTLMIYYFFYDIAVYAGIALCCLLGVFAVTDVVSFWIMYFCAWARTSIQLNFRLCGRTVDTSLYVTKLCVFPLSVALIVTWLVFRNDPNIGWPMQSVIGVITVSWILKTSGLSFMSLKMITIFFALITLYDIFFVFITPLFHSSGSSSPVVEPRETALVRQVRSVGHAESVMEAVATGSAGRSGELLPISFRFQLASKSGIYGCSTAVYRSLLGYGDVVIPGLLSGYLIFFDSFWQTRLLRNFVASLIGYILGLVVTHIALNTMQAAQPALLYLCPCTLGVVVLCSGLFGGLEELRRLWTGSLPAMLSNSQSPPPDSNDHKQEVEFMDATSLDGDGDGFVRSGTLLNLVPRA